MGGFYITMIIGFLLFSLGKRENSLFFMILGVAMILIPAGLIIWVKIYKIRDDRAQQQAKIDRAIDDQRRTENLAELDWIFDNWLAENGGLWILKYAIDDTPYECLKLVRRDGSEAIFDLRARGYTGADRFFKHLADRLYCLRDGPFQIMSPDVRGYSSDTTFKRI